MNSRTGILAGIYAIDSNLLVSGRNSGDKRRGGGRSGDVTY